MNIYQLEDIDESRRQSSNYIALLSLENNNKTTVYILPIQKNEYNVIEIPSLVLKLLKTKICIPVLIHSWCSSATNAQSFILKKTT